MAFYPHAVEAAMANCTHWSHHTHTHLFITPMPYLTGELQIHYLQSVYGGTVYAQDNLYLFESFSFALCLPQMQTAFREAIVPPQEKEHLMGVILTTQSTEKKYPPLLIFHCALITSRLPHVLSIRFYKVINPFLLQSAATI